MPQAGVAEPRRGQARADTLPAAADLPFGMCEFDGQVIVNYGAGKTSTSYGLGYVDGTSLSVYSGTYNPVDDDGSNTEFGRMKFGFAGQYLYFCTTTGPKALEVYNGTPRTAGLLRMPDVAAVMASAATLGTSGSGLPYGSSRAYRSVLRKPTNNGTSLLSPPSGRSIVSNLIVVPAGSMTRTGGTTVTVTVPGAINIGLNTGDTVTLTPGEANFAAGAYVLTGASSNQFTYTDVGANVSNTAEQQFDTGDRPVSVTVTLSTQASTTTPVRLYRSLDTTSADPSDEMFLVAEVLPSSSDITNGYVVIDDQVPESVISDPLYTNPLTGDGPTQANYMPPMYRDTANWGERQWYANNTQLYRFDLQMLGVGTPDGIQNNDTLTINVTGFTGTPYVFTFKTSPSGSNDVQIFSDSTPSANIQNTAQRFVLIFNNAMISGAVGMRAYYMSAQNSPPGMIQIERTTFGDNAIQVKASRPETWTPALKTSSYTDGTNDRIPNGLSYAKLGQPEAVPPVNYTAVGSKNFPIARILGLQQALLVFKEGDGIYAVTGSPPFNIQQVSTANIIAKDTACIFSDVAWVYTDQGILRVSDSGGATVVSRPIETELNRLLNLLPDETADYSFAVPYETERRVLFFVPFELDGTTPVLRAWCYNAASQAWTGPLYSYAFGGVVSSTVDGFRDRRLFLGVYDDAFSTSRITMERNGEEPEYENYVDGTFTTSISEVTADAQGVTVVRLASVTGVSDYDLLTQGSNTSAVTLRPDLGSTWAEPLDQSITWTVAACSISQHYDMTLQFQPQGNPSARKTLTRLTWLMKPEWFSSPFAKSLVMTDQIQANEEIDTPSVGFGMNPFGSSPFGDPTPLVVDVNPIDPKWTNAAQFFVGMTVPVAWSKLKLQGFSVRLETADAPTGRGR